MLTKEFKSKVTAGALALSMLATPGVVSAADAVDTRQPILASEKTIPRVTLPGTFAAYDYSEGRVSKLVHDSAAANSSDDRLSIAVYGGSDDAVVAAVSAGTALAERIFDTSVVELDDNDPLTVLFQIHTDGIKAWEETISNEGLDVENVMYALYGKALIAHRVGIVPFLKEEMPRNDRQSSYNDSKALTPVDFAQLGLNP